MKKKRVVAGVKARTGKPVRAVPVSRTREIGGVKKRETPPPVCSRGCSMVKVGPLWYHQSDCKNTVVLWDWVPGASEEAWKQLCDCPPSRLPSGWTHHWACRAWGKDGRLSGRTPFDDDVLQERREGISWLKEVEEHLDKDKARTMLARVRYYPESVR